MAPQAWGNQGSSNYQNNASIWQLGDYSHLQRQLLVIYPVFLALALIFTGLRLWSRQIKTLRLAPNDYLLLAACFFNICFVVVLLLELFLGAGRSFPDLQNPKAQMTTTYKTHAAVGVLWSLVNTCVKISMAELYARIFPGKAMKRTAIGFTVFSLINFVFAVIVAPLGCTGAQSPQKLAHVRNAYMAIGIINLLLDVVVILMPVLPLSRLQLRLSKKISLICIFALGFVITAISAVRVAAFSAALKNPMGGRGLAYNTYAMPLWSFLETSLSIINACLPVMFPAILAIGHRLSTSWSALAGSTFGRHSQRSNSPEPKAGLSGDTAASNSTAKRLFNGLKHGRLDKTLPSLPDNGSHASRSQTSVSGGRNREEEKWKDAYYLEETRIGDEESLNSDDSFSKGASHDERRGREGEGIVVERGWVVNYGKR